MNDVEIQSCLKERLTNIETRIANACRRVGRARTDVTMVAVTKMVSVRVARTLHGLGVADFGENRPQELWRKAQAMKDLPVRWHMIGHLQRNKVERTLPVASLVHAVDSARLLQEIDRQAEKRQIAFAVLLEVNASREPNKHGFSPELVPEIVASLSHYPNVAVRGLMTMAAQSGDAKQCRSIFAEVRHLSERFAFENLSMGMSNDFEIAIEEGATHVRLGTILFEGLEEKHASASD